MIVIRKVIKRKGGSLDYFFFGVGFREAVKYYFADFARKGLKLLCVSKELKYSEMLK